MKEEKLYDATDLNISFEQGRLRGEKDIKDALMEYINKELAANRKYQEVCLSDRYFGGICVALERLIDKLNEM